MKTLTKFVCNGSRQSTFVGDSALLPSDVTDFAMLPTERLTYSCDLQVANESVCCWEKKFLLDYITTLVATRNFFTVKYHTCPE